MSNTISKSDWFKRGTHDGIPIALGYLAVSFTLGIAAKNAGLTAFQAMLASFLNLASAGEFAGFTLISASASYFQMALMTLVVNARYLLMSCALSQKMSVKTGLLHRMLVGYGITDEIFGISIGHPEELCPYYNYGAMILTVPAWSLGTFLGVLVGNVLPGSLVSALSVGLYGMFIAVIIPPARKSKIIAVLVTLSMLSSFLFTKLPYVSTLSNGTRIIILTVLLSGLAAFFFPLKEEPENDA